MNQNLKIRLHLLTIGFIVFLAFLPALGAEFVNWDDHSHLVENKAVQSFDVHRMFSRPVQKIYIPMTSLSFAVERKFFGNNPLIYHLDNILLHIANAFLVYGLVRRLGLEAMAAFWTALLFGVHPMRVESVAWVTERKDLLYTFLYLWALVFYAIDIQRRGNKSVFPTRYYFGTLVCGILSLLSKPMALSLPLVLVLLDWFLRRSVSGRSLLEKIPFVLYVVPITWVTYAFHVRNPVGDVLQAVLIWVWTFNFYLWKFLFPLVLVPVYHLPAHVSLTNPSYAVSLVLFAAIAILSVRFPSRWWRFALAYYFLSIFFLLRFDIGKDINIVADRFMYLPSLGFCILFGLWVQKLHGLCLKKFPALAPGAFVVAWVLIAGLCCKSIVQTRVWNDTISLWTYVIKYNPTEFLAYNDRAVGYINRGYYDLAIADYTKILEFSVGDADAHFNRGLAYKKVGRYQSAVEDFTKVIDRYPYYERAYLHRAMSLEALGQKQAALEDYTRAVSVSPAFSDGYFHRGNFFNKQGQLNSALDDYNRAIGLSPFFGRAISNRGVVYAKLSDDRRALDDFNAAIAIDPSFADSYYNRSVVYRRLNKKKEALADALKVIQLGGMLPEGYLQALQ